MRRHGVMMNERQLQKMVKKIEREIEKQEEVINIGTKDENQHEIFGTPTDSLFTDANDHTRVNDDRNMNDMGRKSLVHQ